MNDKKNFNDDFQYNLSEINQIFKKIKIIAESGMNKCEHIKCGNIEVKQSMIVSLNNIKYYVDYVFENHIDNILFPKK